MWRIWTRGWGIRGWWAWVKESIPMWMAWALPRRVALWAFIRVYAADGEAPTPDYEKKYKHWEKKTGIQHLALIALLASFAVPALAKDWTIIPANGADEAQRIARSVKPGDTIIGAKGELDVSSLPNGLRFATSGTAAAPITFRAASPGEFVIVGGKAADTCLSLLGCNYWVVDGIVCQEADRIGLLVTNSSKVAIRRCKGLRNGTTGLLAGFCDDLTVEASEWAWNGEQHGIYISNGGDRPIVRRNDCHDNGRAGVQLNGDQKHLNPDIGTRGDGIIEDARVTDNRIWRCGLEGAAAIQFLNVHRGAITGNTVWDCYATGVTFSTDAVTLEERTKYASRDCMADGNDIRMPATTPDGKPIKRAVILSNNGAIRNTYKNTRYVPGVSSEPFQGNLADGGGNVAILATVGVGQ